MKTSLKLVICFVSYRPWIDAFVLQIRQRSTIRAEIRNIRHTSCVSNLAHLSSPCPIETTATAMYSSLDDNNESISYTSGESKKQEKIGKNRLDNILSTLTSGFPFFVLGAALLALYRPSLFMWTNNGNLMTMMLALVMSGTGLTLTKEDFTVVLKKDIAAVPVGVLCQFLIMPMVAYTIGKALFLRSSVPYGSNLFLGLCLVGCSPGGTASNLVSLIARADVALSVILTSCSTILASIVTPLLLKLLVGSTIAISGWTLCTTTASVVLFPVLFGMIVNSKAPNLASRISRFMPFCGVVLVALICGGVVAENTSLLVSATSSSGAVLIPRIVSAVLGLHCIGFLAGYIIPRQFLGFAERTSRTICIETGMQNSALAVVLARSIGAPSIASLPGAISATVHSCLGSLLAAYWRGVDNRSSKVEGGNKLKKGVDLCQENESQDDYPELLI